MNLFSFIVPVIRLRPCWDNILNGLIDQFEAKAMTNKPYFTLSSYSRDASINILLDLMPAPYGVLLSREKPSVYNMWSWRLYIFFITKFSGPLAICKHLLSTHGKQMVSDVIVPIITSFFNFACEFLIQSYLELNWTPSVTV